MNHPRHKPKKRSSTNKQHYNDTPHALFHRSSHYGNDSVYSRTDFYDDVSLYRQGSSGMTLLHDPQIVSPHTGAITSVDVNSDYYSCTGRFMLVGSSDCTISVYDLSRLGSEYHDTDIDNDNNQDGFRVGESRKRARRKPVAQSRRLHASSLDVERVEAGTYAGLKGHRYGVVSVQWYPVDTGMFISVENNGIVHLWDTNEFCIVESFRAQAQVANRGALHGEAVGIQSAVLPRNVNSSHMLIACGCGNEGKVKLCDITSGSFTHELIGHSVSESINSLAWSPADDYILSSCSSDGTIRLWDIRKSGSAACLMILNHEYIADNRSIHFNKFSSSSGTAEVSNRVISRGSIGLGYNGLNYEELRAMENEKLSRLPEHFTYIMNKDIIDSQKKSSIIAPNNFSISESSFIKSHTDAVTAISFSPDGQHLVSTGLDTRIRLWDLRVLSGIPVPTVFLGANGKGFSRRTFNSLAKNSLAITQAGSTRTSTIWCGNEFGDLLGYRLHHTGGRPELTLRGHLDRINCMTTINSEQRIFTGSNDGMVLGWGCVPSTISRLEDRFDHFMSGMNGDKIEDHDTW